MTSRKEIIDSILSIFRAHADTKTVEWHKGEPPRSRWNQYPFGWVEWVGGPIEPRTAISEKHKPMIHIVVNSKHVDEDKAEDSVMDYAEKLESVIEGDRTLGGMATTCWFIFDEKSKMFEEDYSIAGIRLTLKVLYVK